MVTDKELRDYKKAFMKVLIGILVFWFALATFEYFTYNQEMSSIIFQPMLEMNGTIAFFVFGGYLLFIVWLKRLDTKKGK